MTSSELIAIAARKGLVLWTVSGVYETLSLVQGRVIAQGFTKKPHAILLRSSYACNAYVQKPKLGGDPVGSQERQAEFIVTKLKSNGWVGPATHVSDLSKMFQFYHSEGKGFSQMATLRLFFRAGKVTAYKAR